MRLRPLPTLFFVSLWLWACGPRALEGPPIAGPPPEGSGGGEANAGPDAELAAEPAATQDAYERLAASYFATLEAYGRARRLLPREESLRPQAASRRSVEGATREVRGVLASMAELSLGPLPEGLAEPLASDRAELEARAEMLAGFVADRDRAAASDGDDEDWDVELDAALETLRRARRALEGLLSRLPEEGADPRGRCLRRRAQAYLALQDHLELAGEDQEEERFVAAQEEQDARFELERLRESLRALGAQVEGALAPAQGRTRQRELARIHDDARYAASRVGEIFEPARAEPLAEAAEALIAGESEEAQRAALGRIVAELRALLAAEPSRPEEGTLLPEGEEARSRTEAEATAQVIAAWRRGGEEGAARYRDLRGLLGGLPEEVRSAQGRAAEACGSRVGL